MEDVSVDFDWVEADETRASDKSERKKELLRKLDRTNSQLLLHFLPCLGSEET